jgi:hypothetical protein
LYHARQEAAGDGVPEEEEEPHTKERDIDSDDDAEQEAEQRRRCAAADAAQLTLSISRPPSTLINSPTLLRAQGPTEPRATGTPSGAAAQSQLTTE